MCVNGMVTALMSNYGHRSIPKSLHVSQQKYSICYSQIPEIILSSIDGMVFHNTDPLCRVDYGKIEVSSWGVCKSLDLV